jgi:hypothetical protein
VRRLPLRIIAVLWLVAMIGSAALVGGAAMNDRTIHSDPGRSLATVTGVGVLRTAVDYQTEEGRFYSPGGGLLYPSGLGEGQQVWVTYAKSDPDLVAVEGRRWTLSIIPALSIAAVATAVAAVAALAVGGLTRKEKSTTLSAEDTEN